jgi:glycine/D-amino acid oxidase-like deaminating enzyme
VTPARIAVLGGGMLGTCTALDLARRGRSVTLIEGAPALLQGASRWNEGKIHLGFLYAADETLNTAARLIPGGLAFNELVTRLIEQPLDEFITEDDDVFLVHRDSVVDASAFASYADRTATLVREAATAHDAPRYLADVTNAVARRLSPKELAEITSSSNVVAGYRVPERSISTVAIADRLCRRVRSEPLIDVRVDTTVTAVHRRESGRLDIQVTGPNSDDYTGFDVVVNALWEGRPAVDATMGFAPPAPWSHRFRAAVFGHAPESTLRSGVLCTGPFGDVKRYADGRVYLSWYEAGLLAEGSEILPPRSAAVLSPERQREVARGTIGALSTYFPAVTNLAQEAHELEVHGGWVYAVGQGSLSDRASTLHQRDKFNMSVDRGYISVDTAKYSLAPWLAARVAEIIADL